MLLEKLTLVVKEKRAEFEEQQAKETERLEKLEKYKELLQKEGINAEDLIALLNADESGKRKSKKRQAFAPKYQYEENGQLKTWSGQGRMPNALKAAIEAGQSLSSFEI